MFPTPREQRAMKLVKVDRRSFNEEWRIKYLMDYNCPAERGGTYAEFMICILCEQQFKCIK